MSELHFAEPGWVHLLWGVAAFVAMLAWLERRGSDALARFVGSVLQPRLLRGPSRFQRGLRIALLGLAGSFLTLALMRPQWGLELVSTPRAGAEIMICLDVSKSMLAEDVAPNRLDRAKAEIRDLLGYLDGDQVGLIAFAGRATVLSPLTPDFGFLRLALEHAGPHTVGRGGTRLEEPVRKAIAGFGDTGDVSRSILLITDGEDHDSFPLEAARDAAERGISIIAIGFGDEAGSEITITDSQTGSRTVLRDAEGQVVNSRLDGDLLRELALTTGGAYVPAGTGALDLESIYQRHLVTLTRGRLDGRTRAVRNDAYQWAVLLGLLALLGAVASTARGGGIPGRDVGTTLSGLALPVLLGLVVWTLPVPALAQAPQSGTAPKAEADAGGQPHVTASADSAVEAPIPEDAREAYNRGLELLEAGEVAQASRMLAAARERAGTDGEARFRATYNLGWTEVEAADAAMEADPEQALEHLYRAADWFQEAVRLRDAHEASRYNLELVTRRALELADSLAEHGEADVAEALDRLIVAQRAFLTELRAGLGADSLDDQPGTTPELRRAYRGLATRQLTVLADSDGLNEQVARELEGLEAKTGEPREPEDRLRAAQLDALLGHLNRARERLAQTRTRLRRLQGERAYRRASNALGALKRARDQLLDPLSRLDALLAEGSEVTRQTALQVASSGGPGGFGEPVTRPRWLTNDYLAAEQSDLEARTAELHDGLRSGLEGEAGGAGKPTPSQTDSPEREQLIARLREAAPLIGEARAAFSEAAGALAMDRSADALAAQRRGLERLASARERFLDLRQLIELVYTEESRVRGVLAEGVATTAGEVREAVPISEIAPLLDPVHERNVERMTRLGGMITDAAIEAGRDQAPPGGGQPIPGATPSGATPEQQRYELAYELWRPASDAMHVVQDRLDALASGAPGGEVESKALVDATAGAADAAVSALEALRRLFFSVLEHLKETAKRQQELADETEEAAALGDLSDPEGTLRRAGPLAPRQAGLREMAGAIADGLRQQATATPPAPSGDGHAQVSGADAARSMKQAADKVGEAQANMSEATTGLEQKPPGLALAREAQDRALAGLLEAIALLERPPEQSPQADQGDRSPEQQDGGEGQPEPAREQSPANMAQLLQGVRDREARRREDRDRTRNPGYEPVEKDW